MCIHIWKKFMGTVQKRLNQPNGERPVNSSMFFSSVFLMNMNASGTNDPPLERGDAGEQFRLQVAVEDVYH